jgi:phospholipid/cholesterol/gamma-HCH transport system substrate-binding protein
MMEETRERALVGLFVILAAVLLLGSVLAITGGLGKAGVPHRAYFKYAGGVQPGAAVRFGGLLVGKVDRVRVDPTNSTRIEIDFEIDRATPVKTDSIAKITTLGPLTDNYIEITTGSERAALLPPGAEIPSTEMFGLPQLGDAVQAMLPDVQRTLRKVNDDLDGLQVTLARANDLLSDRNRATIAHSLANADQLLSEARPQVNQTLGKVSQSLDNVNRLLNDAQPKVSASLSNIQEVTAKLGPLLEDVKKVSVRADDTLAHVDATLLENRADIRSSVTSLRDALAKSAGLLDQLNQALDQNADNVDELLDNLRISTENLKSLTETLRSSPASLIRGVHVEDRKPGGVKK